MDVMTLAAKLTLNTSEFNSGLNQSEKELKGLTSGGVAWGNLVARTVEKAGKAVVDFGKKTVKVGMDFDSQMSQVKALGQLEDDEFTKVRDKAMELGKKTKFTATQVAEAFSYMALAGWDTQDMLNGIDGVLNLAAASGEDLGRTSDIVTDALTAMGLTAKDTNHFVDVLAQASANSNTSVGQMGEAFKYLATTGGVLDYTIDDVALALGLLANNGIKAGQAGTSMRRILSTLISPTEEASAAMRDLGISLFDPETNARKPLGQVLKEFRDVFKEAGLQLEEGFDPEEIGQRIEELDAWYDEERKKIESDSGKDARTKNKLLGALAEQYSSKLFDTQNPNQAFLSKLSDIGGLRGVSSLFAIMGTTDEDFEKLSKQIENSNGAAEDMATTMLDNLEGDVTIMKSAFEGLQIAISDEFKEKARSFVQNLTNEIGKLNEVFETGGLSAVVGTLAGDLVNGVVDFVTKNPDKITGIIITLVNIFAENAPKFVDALIKIVSDERLWVALGDMFKSIWQAIFGTPDENLNDHLFGGFDNETTEQGSNAIQDYIDAFNKKNKDLMRLMDLEINGETGTEEYASLTKSVEEADAQVQKLYEDMMKVTDANGKNLFSSYMTWAYENGYNGVGDLPDFPVELIPDNTAVLEEVDAGYTATVKLYPDATNMPVGYDGSPGFAKGLWDVPYDDFTANLHRGEMVLTASQARRYREGDGSADLSGLEDRIEAAIRRGMEGVSVRSYLNGKDITDEVNRNTVNQVKARRFA